MKAEVGGHRSKLVSAQTLTLHRKGILTCILAAVLCSCCLGELASWFWQHCGERSLVSQGSAQSLFGTLPKPHGPHVGLSSWAGPPAQWENPVASFAPGGGFSLTHLTSSLCRVLLCNRQESRPMEWMAQQFLGVVARVFPTAYSVPVETVARAMVASVLQPGEGKVEVLENRAIHELGKAVPQQGT